MKQLSNTPIEQLIRNVKIGLNNKANIIHTHGSYTDDYKKYSGNEGLPTISNGSNTDTEFWYKIDLDNGIRILNMQIIIHEYFQNLRYFSILSNFTAQVIFPYSFIDDNISVYFSFPKILNREYAVLKFFPKGSKYKCTITFNNFEYSSQTVPPNCYSHTSWYQLCMGENNQMMNILAIGKWK